MINGLDFSFVKLPFLIGDVLRAPSYNIYISSFFRACSSLEEVIAILRRSCDKEFMGMLFKNLESLVDIPIFLLCSKNILRNLLKRI